MGAAKCKISVLVLLTLLVMVGCESYKPVSEDCFIRNSIVIEFSVLQGMQTRTYFISEKRIIISDKGEKVEVIGIQANEFDELITLALSLHKFKTEYSGGGIDGYTWKVLLTYNGVMDYLYLTNKSFKETNKLFIELNQLIPGEKYDVLIR